MNLDRTNPMRVKWEMTAVRLTGQLEESCGATILQSSIHECMGTVAFSQEAADASSDA